MGIFAVVLVILGILLLLPGLFFAAVKFLLWIGLILIAVAIVMWIIRAVTDRNRV